MSDNKLTEDVIKTTAINLAKAERLVSLGYWDWDLITNNVKWSDGHFRIFGYTVAHGTETYEMWRDRVHPEDIESIERVLRESKEKDTGYNWDYRLLFPDGSVRYIHAEAESPVKDAFGKPIRWFGTVQDITELKRIEDSLREKEKHFKLLSEVNSLLLSSKDPEATVQTIAECVMHHLNSDVFFNYVYDKIHDRLHLNAYGGISAEAAKEIEWLDKGEALCGCVASQGCRIVSEDVQHNGDKRAELVRSMEIQAYACHPLRISEKIIGTISFGTRSRKSFKEDELALISTVADKVSIAIDRMRIEYALRVSEERFRALVTASSEVVYRMSPNWDKMYYLRGRKFIPDTCSANSTWLDKYIHPDDQPHVTAVINEAIRTKSTFKLEHRVLQVDGSLGWTFSRAVPLLNDNGEIIEWFGAASDITERKRAEEALHESEERLRRFYESGLLGVIYWNMDGKIIDANDKFLEMVGYTREDLQIGHIDWQNMTPPEYQYLDAASIKELQATGVNAVPFEKKYIRKDGSRVPIIVAGAMLDEARFNGVAFVLDITERKRIEEALRENEARIKVAEATDAERQRLYNVLEALPVNICLLTSDYHFAFCNRNFREKFGECGGKRCYELCFGYDKPCEFCESYNVLRTGQPHHWECTLMDGSIIDAHDFPFTDIDGSPMILEMDFDITERKKAEEALKLSNSYNRNLIETSLDTLVTIGPDGKIKDVNVATEKVTGYSRNDLIGTDFSNYFTEPEKAEEAYQRVFQKGSVRDYSLKIQNKHGQVVPVLYNATVLKNEVGETIGAFAAARDISGLKKVEDSLAQMEKTRIKEIHHRIKNNLQVISSLLDLQAEKFEDLKVVQAFREAQNRVISMSLIHEELFKGGEADKLNFSSYLQKLAKTLFQTYILKSDNIRLNMDLEDNAFLDMDTAVPLGIIVNELVSNSLKHAFTENPEGEIRIRLCREEGNKETQESLFSLTISDNGPESESKYFSDRL